MSHQMRCLPCFGESLKNKDQLLEFGPNRGMLLSDFWWWPFQACSEFFWKNMLKRLHAAGVGPEWHWSLSSALVAKEGYGLGARVGGEWWLGAGLRVVWFLGVRYTPHPDALRVRLHCRSNWESYSGSWDAVIEEWIWKLETVLISELPFKERKARKWQKI